MTAVATDIILAPGEKVLWQGRPKPPADLRIPRAYVACAVAAGGLIYLAAAELLGTDTMPAGTEAFVAILIFGAIAVWLMTIHEVAHKRVLRRSEYTLTTDRAYITVPRGHHITSVHSYALRPATEIEFHVRPPQSIFFAQGDRASIFDPKRTKIRFEHISEGQMVYHLIRQVQRGEVAP